MKETILLIIGVLIYMLIGTFLAGVFGVDDDDVSGNIIFTVFWPVGITLTPLIIIAFGLSTICSDIGDFIRGLGRKLVSGIKSIFTKKEKPKTHPYYTETDTRCDKCDLLNTCLEADGLLDITKMSDSRKHYLPSMGFECKLKEEAKV